MAKDRKLKLGIIGHGFVGKAMDEGFDRNVDKFIVDPMYKTTIDDLAQFDPELIFICVPTPMGKDGKQDSSIIESVLEELKVREFNAIVVIKSTVIPNVLIKLEKLGTSFIYNPEFLREKHASEDFKNSPAIILGGNKKNAKKVANYYIHHSNCRTEEYIYLSLLSASLVKYTINTFLATKVSFFNEIYEIFQTLESEDNWDDIVSAVSADKRIGSSHMNVPGHDGKRGFGGACFPKDTAALIKYSNDISQDLSVLKAAVQKNNQLRKKYKDLDKREKDQNISFDYNI